MKHPSPQTASLVERLAKTEDWLEPMGVMTPREIAIYEAHRQNVREAASTITTLLALRDALHLENERLLSTITRLEQVEKAAQRREAAEDHLHRYLHNDGTDDADCRKKGHGGGWHFKERDDAVQALRALLSQTPNPQTGEKAP